MSIIIRNAATNEYDEVFKLIHDAYVEANYIEPNTDGRFIHYPHLNSIPQTTVLVAVDNGVTVGTCSITIDSQSGLHTDEDFNNETEQVRKECRKLASSWRLATKIGYRSKIHIIRKLIQANIDYFAENNIETCLMTLVTRHVPR
ncbi:MAG: hypothetical protein EOO88_41775, partial [Pedobacter sp.]